MSLTEREQLLQAAHDEAHPGKVCGTCPKEVAWRASLYEQAQRAWQPKEDYTYVVIIAAVFTALVLLWLFL